MYKRVHPERKANSGEARRVKYYHENAVLGVLVVFILASLCFGVFLLADRVTCGPRPAARHGPGRLLTHPPQVPADKHGPRHLRQ